MGSVFAVQVRTGFEIKAKEMLSFVLKKEHEPLVKSIYALETYTEIVNENSITNTELTEEESLNQLKKQELRALITNKRRQLEVIKRYNSECYEKTKENYRKEINELEKEFKKISTNSKKIKSVLSGYILVELRYQSQKLPDRLWHLINSVPLVQKILSVDPIPEEEMMAFAEKMDEILEPQVEFKLEEDLSEEEALAIQKELVKKLNFNELTDKEESAIINKIDSVKEKMIDKIKTFLKSKQNNKMISQIKILRKKSKNIVNLPLSTFVNLYPNREVIFIKDRVSSKDFLYRLKRVSALE